MHLRSHDFMKSTCHGRGRKLWSSLPARSVMQANTNSYLSLLHCVSKKRANFGNLLYQQPWTNFGKQHQHNLKNDTHVQLSLSFHFYLLYLFLNSCGGNDTFWRHSILVKQSSSFSWKHWILSLQICVFQTVRLTTEFVDRYRNMCTLYNHLSATPAAVTSHLKQRLIDNLYSNDLPVTRGRKFTYADHICLAIQGQYFSELECSLLSDMVRMSHLNEAPLKQSAVCFTCIIPVPPVNCQFTWMASERLRHECYPTYLGWL